MPTEITGGLKELHITPLFHIEGILAVKQQIPINYNGNKELKTDFVDVIFSSDSQEVCDIIRKSNGMIKLTGRFGNNGDQLVFYANTAEETK